MTDAPGDRPEAITRPHDHHRSIPSIPSITEPSMHAENTMSLPGCVPWPDEFARRYRAAGYWRGDTLGALSRSWAKAWPERTALVDASGRVTYAELHHRVERTAAASPNWACERAIGWWCTCPTPPTSPSSCWP